MTNNRAESETEVQHVVFTLDDEGRAWHMLDVVEGQEELQETIDKWWKAFHYGEKQKPKDYDGIGHRPVADFERWEDG